MTTVSQASSAPPIEQLHRLLNDSSHREPSRMQRIFKIAEQIGINEKNYLPWKDQYYWPGSKYISLKCSDLQDKKLVWGYDPLERPFITFQYTVKTENEDKTVQESTTIFQRYPNRGDYVLSEGMIMGNKKYYVDEWTDKKLQELDSLFQGKTVIQNNTELDENLHEWIEKKREITFIKD